MKESVISTQIKNMLRHHCDEVYSNEVGFVVVPDGKGGVRPRPGGTRTTPGWPDLFFLMNSPFTYELTVECKKPTGQTSDDQWRYALLAMRRGQAHLMCRDTDELLTGLCYLGLLPTLWRKLPPLPWDPNAWPQNVNYLPQQREAFWQRQTLDNLEDHDSMALPTMVSGKAVRPYGPPSANKRRQPPYPEPYTMRHGHVVRL